MERLTERELNVMDCASYTKCNTNECVGYCGGCNAEEEAKLKLKHYEDLEEQGLLLKLPCKVGDVVYRINQYAKEPIISMKVSKIVFMEELSGYSNLRIDAIDVMDFGESCYFRKDIGRTVFLTKAEAEKALEEMKGE